MTLSQLFSIEYSVPQSSVLGYLWFLYINKKPLIDSKNVVYLSLFEDDLATFMFNKIEHISVTISRYLKISGIEILSD